MNSSQTDKKTTDASKKKTVTWRSRGSTAKRSDAERILERLDAQYRTLEAIADAVMDYLGIEPPTDDVDTGDTEEDEDDSKDE